MKPEDFGSLCDEKKGVEIDVVSMDMLVVKFRTEVGEEFSTVMTVDVHDAKGIADLLYAAIECAKSLPEVS